MPYRKPLKARSGAAMEYDSGDYPACQAEALNAIGWDDFAAATGRGAQGRPLYRHRPRPRRQGLRPRAVRVGPGADFADRQGHGVHRRLGDGPGARHRDGADRRGAARRRRRQGEGGGGRHRGRIARPRRLRQPADRHRRLVGASRGQGRGRQGQEGGVARARSRRERPRTGRRRGARDGRAATQRQARRDRAHPAGRAGLRLSGRRRSRPRSQRPSPHRCAGLRERLPRLPRSRSMPRPAR